MEKFWGLVPLLTAPFMRQNGNNFIYSTVNLYHWNNQVSLNSFSVSPKPHYYDFGQEWLAEASFQLYSWKHSQIPPSSSALVTVLSFVLCLPLSPYFTSFLVKKSIKNYYALCQINFWWNTLHYNFSSSNIRTQTTEFQTDLIFWEIFHVFNYSGRT